MRRPKTYGGTGPSWLKWITRLSLLAGVIALVVTVWLVGPDTLLAHLETIGPWFALLLVLELAVSMLDAGVVYSMTRGPGAPSARSVFVAQLAGRAVNSVTPGAAIGEALRVSLLARECSPQRIVAAVMFASIGSFVVGLVLIAAGTIATALLFTMPSALELTFHIVGGVCAVLAVALVWLVQRGMVTKLALLGRKLRLISQARHERWRDQLASLDRRLVENEHRGKAMLLLLASQLLQRGVIWVTLLAAGYSLSGPQLVAILSAGVLLTWASALVPMGVGVSEGGNGALFALIGAPTSLGVALAFARRVNQIIFAALGFSVLAADRIANHVEVDVMPPPEQAVVR